jgi:hypothetical protein
MIDDTEQVDISDGGSIPPTSTKNTLVGRNVHGQVERVPEWYYTPNEWSRSIGWGKVPDERNAEFGGDRFRRGEEKSEENIKKL